MKNIIVPVDFSPYSLSAAKTGAYLARKAGAQMHLLHVIKGPADYARNSPSQLGTDDQLNEKITDAQHQLEKFARSSFLKGIDVVTYLKVGTPFQHIADLAKREQSDLIVMGAHGEGESHSIFIGSTAQRVMRTTLCPVLSVKQQFVPKAFRKIMFASNFEENVREAVRKVKAVALTLKASVELVFVNTPGHFVDTDAIEQRMQKYMPEPDGVKFSRSVYNDFDAERGVQKAAKKTKANMIAMITHSREGKPSYQLGLTETLLYHADVPVLSIVLK